MEQTGTRKSSAVLMADAVGYSRLIGKDEPAERGCRNGQQAPRLRRIPMHS